MRLILVRHGEPNYTDDCLTEAGWVQARAAAERLKDEPIAEIWSSSCGRAVETAMPTAEMHSLPIQKVDFMREIRWRTPGLAFDGHVWMQTDQMVLDNENLRDENWREHPYFKGGTIVPEYDRVASGLDLWLKALGFVREGDFYRCTKESGNKTLALFCHGGSSSVLLSHVLDLPFPYVCTVYRPNYTTITVLDFVERENTLILPRIEILADTRHIDMGAPVYNY